MLQTLWEHVERWLGLEQDVGNLNPLHMAVRTVVVYGVALAIIRLGSKRFLAQATAFDAVAGVMLGSVLSRAINGSAPFFASLAAGAVLVAMHSLLRILTVHVRWAGPILKGNPVVLIEDGKVRPEGVRRAGISCHDLEQAIRAGGSVADPADVRLAVLERSGRISVVPADRPPRVVDVAVRDGVQTVRVELG